MKSRRSLRARLLLGLAGYALLLTAAVFVHGFVVNEFAERLVWRSLLHTEMDHLLARRAQDPGYQWSDTDNLKLYLPDNGRPVPPEIAGLPPGLHDEMFFDGSEQVVLVREQDGKRYLLALDIAELESVEADLGLFILGSTLVLVLLMGLLMAWGLQRALSPLSQLASSIAGLKPDRGGQRIELDRRASSELVVIAGALNDYLRRHEAFVERERVFIDTASHELRTPIAVIAGASELAMEQRDLPPAARQQVLRIHRTARDVERLLSLLLTLAKDPARLSRSNDLVALHELLPEIVRDHRYLLQDKDLEIVASELVPCRISAPLNIVQAAIGNLLRNAIENSDQGVIRVGLSADATVTIEDPGHGMTPEEISRIYAQVARGGGREGGGIGMDLLARLCEHLGWALTIQSTPGRGTVSRLKLAR